MNEEKLCLGDPGEKINQRGKDGKRGEREKNTYPKARILAERRSPSLPVVRMLPLLLMIPVLVGRRL